MQELSKKNKSHLVAIKILFRRDFKWDFFFFCTNFFKNGVRNWHISANEIFKASDAFILPYKYNAQISNIEIYDGEFFPKPHKKFWKEQIKLWEKEQSKNNFG